MHTFVNVEQIKANSDHRILIQSLSVCPSVVTFSFFKQFPPFTAHFFFSSLDPFFPFSRYFPSPFFYSSMDQIFFLLQSFFVFLYSRNLNFVLLKILSFSVLRPLQRSNIFPIPIVLLLFLLSIYLLLRIKYLPSLNIFLIFLFS